MHRKKKKKKKKKKLAKIFNKLVEKLRISQTMKEQSSLSWALEIFR